MFNRQRPINRLTGRPAGYTQTPSHNGVTQPQEYNDPNTTVQYQQPPTHNNTAFTPNQQPGQAGFQANQRPINRLTGQPAGYNTQQQNNNAQQQYNQQQYNNAPQLHTNPQQQVQYTTTNPNAQGVSQYSFEQGAKQMNALDPTYLDRRDDYIANQIVNQLNAETANGRLINQGIYDGIMQSTIAQFGGQIDYSSPDWINTIDRINGKIKKKVGARELEDVYHTINTPLHQTNQYTSEKQIYNDIKNGKINKSQLEQIQRLRPDLYASYEQYAENEMKLKIINKTGISTQPLLYDSLNTDELFAKFGLDKANSRDIDLVAKRVELMGTGTFKSSQAEYIQSMRKYKEINDQIKNIEDDVRKQYEGTGAPESTIAIMVANRTKELTKQLHDAMRSAELAQTNHNLEVGQLNEMMRTYQAQASLDLQYDEQDMKKFGIVLDVMKGEQARRDSIKLSDIEFQREIYQKQWLLDMEQGNITSEDPTIRKRAIEREVDTIMRDYDGLIMSSRAELVERIQRDMNAGKSFGDAVGSIMQDIRKKPHYKQYMMNKSGISIIPQSIGGGFYTQYDSNGNISIVSDEQLKRSSQPGWREQVTQAISAQRAQYGASEYDDIEFVGKLLKGDYVAERTNADGSKTPVTVKPGAWGGECAWFVNTVLKESFGNSIQAKINYTKQPDKHSPVPVIGGAVVFDRGTKYGHVGIITAVDPDGKGFTYMDSNGTLGKDGIGTKTIAFGRKGKVTDKTYFTVAPGRASPSKVVSGTDITQGLQSKFKNETQAKAFEFANRMIPSLVIIDNIEATRLQDNNWWKLVSNKTLPNALSAPEYQQYQQAQRDFINAVLRKESGAAISKDEFTNAKKQYFVQPGDSKEVIKQKKNNRQQTLDGFIKTIGDYTAQQYLMQLQQSKQQIISSGDVSDWYGGQGGTTNVEGTLSTIDWSTMPM